MLKEKYADYCYSIIYRLLQDREQTEEALNDVWLQIWNSIPPARPQCLRAYLAKTARPGDLILCKGSRSMEMEQVLR